MKHLSLASNLWETIYVKLFEIFIILKLHELSTLSIANEQSLATAKNLVIIPLINSLRVYKTATESNQLSSRH